MPERRVSHTTASIGISRARRWRAVRAALPLAALNTLGAGSAAAQPNIGQFELKTLECAPGLLEFQSQNAFSWGQPSRLVEDDGSELVFDENSVVKQRHALELEFGFNHFLKMRVGIEFEKERIDDPATIEAANDFEDLELTEYGAELIAVAIPRRGDGAGLGFVAEYEAPIDDDESSALVLGPIVEFQAGPWFATAVPMVVHDFGGNAGDGAQVDDKWDFAYAAQLMYAFSPRWSLALEGYGTVERIGSSGHPSESAELFGDFDQHRLGPVLYYSYVFGGAARSATDSSQLSAEADDDRAGTSLNIGIGFLAGLNGKTPDGTLKLSIEVDF
jgi:hypothetical protein